MSFFSQIGNVIAAVEEFELGVFNAFFSIKDDVNAFVAGLQRLKSFKFEPHWKTRVINVPGAEAAIEDLFDTITHGLADKARELLAALHELENIIKGPSGPPEDGGGGAIADFLSRLASIKLAIVRVTQAFHTVLSLEQMVIDIKQRLESLDDLFLPQGSTKTTVALKYRKRNA